MGQASRRDPKDFDSESESEERRRSDVVGGEASVNLREAGLKPRRRGIDTSLSNRADLSGATAPKSLSPLKRRILGR
jgi:hypothetical protein